MITSVAALCVEEIFSNSQSARRRWDLMPLRGKRAKAMGSDAPARKAREGESLDTPMREAREGEESHDFPTREAREGEESHDTPARKRARRRGVI